MDTTMITTLTRSLLLSILLALPAWAEVTKVAGISFEAPASWKSSPPSSNMRKAQFSATDSSGKIAEIVFFHFGLNSGGVQANVDRWMKQFEDPQDQSIENVKIGEAKVTYAQAHGTFLSGRPFGPKTPNPGYALVAAIIEGKEGAVFIKMTGPKSAVDAHAAGLKKMVEDSLEK